MPLQRRPAKTFCGRHQVVRRKSSTGLTPFIAAAAVIRIRVRPFKTPFGLSPSKPFDKLRANGVFYTSDRRSVSILRGAFAEAVLTLQAPRRAPANPKVVDRWLGLLASHAPGGPGVCGVQYPLFSGTDVEMRSDLSMAITKKGPPT